jgi:hypothetical protein
MYVFSKYIDLYLSVERRENKDLIELKVRISRNSPAVDD